MWSCTFSSEEHEVYSAKVLCDLLTRHLFIKDGNENTECIVRVAGHVFSLNYTSRYGFVLSHRFGSSRRSRSWTLCSSNEVTSLDSKLFHCINYILSILS